MESQTKSEFFAKLTFFVILFILIIGLFCFICRKNSCRTKRRKPWTPPPTLLVIVLFIFLTIAEARPPKPPRHRVIGKSPNPRTKFFKGCATLLGTAALYMGFDTLSQFFYEEPEMSTFILCALILFAVSILIKIILVFHSIFFRKTRQNQTNIPANNPTNEIEMKNYP